MQPIIFLGVVAMLRMLGNPWHFSVVLYTVASSVVWKLV